MYVIWWLILLYWVKLSCSAIFMRVTSRQYVTNRATLLSKSGLDSTSEVESSERQEVSFTRTLRRRKNVFPIIPSDLNAP